MAKTPAPPYRVKLTVGDATVEVEGADSGVVRIVEALSQNLSSGARRPTAPTTPTPAPSGSSFPPTATGTRAPDVRSFFEEKKPSSDVEAAAAAAYYHRYLASEDQRRDSIDSAVLRDTFRLARRPLPPNLRYTLQNARNAGYLDSAGSGEFKLNAVGYNLVEHALGNDDAQAGASGRRRRVTKRKGTKRAGAKTRKNRK